LRTANGIDRYIVQVAADGNRRGLQILGREEVGDTPDVHLVSIGSAFLHVQARGGAHQGGVAVDSQASQIVLAEGANRSADILTALLPEAGRDDDRLQGFRGAGLCRHILGGQRD
jgi:hypothetical protein